MKTFLIIIFALIIGFFAYGYYIKPSDLKLGNLCIGLSVVGLFFIWMPAFIYHRWRKKDIKDYMLTKENIEKMRQESDDKKV